MTKHEDRCARNAARKLTEIVLSGPESMAACRDTPDEVIALLNRELRMAEPAQRGRRYGSALGRDHMFGLRHSMQFDLGCVSAWKGPFLFLLRHEPAKGLKFIVDLLEHAVDWYAHPRFHDPYGSKPGEVVVTLGDGSTRRVWCDGCLWLLYRGGSSAPDVLKCALMALEHWLLQMCQVEPATVPRLLDYLLRRGNSAATAAVVASVVAAHPHLTSEAALVLLRTREFVVLDLDRKSREGLGVAALLGGIAGPPIGPWGTIFQQERRDANQLRHRGRDLEWVALELQTRAATRAAVERILDEHRAALDAVANPGDEHQIWRLALHRMDARRYEPVVAPRPEMQAMAAEAERRGALLYELTPPEPVVKEVLQRHEAARTPEMAQIGVLSWGLGVFDPSGPTSSDPSQWRQYLAAARAIADDAPRRMDGRGHVAAVCIRDHWPELDEPARQWCIDRVCAVLASAPASHDYERTQKNPLSGAGAAGWAAVALAVRDMTPAQRFKVRDTLANALTHPIEDVVSSACRAIGDEIWPRDRALAMHLANAFAGHVTRLMDLYEREEERFYEQRRSFEEPCQERRSFEEIEDSLRPETRAGLLASPGPDLRAIEQLAPRGWVGARGLGCLMQMLVNATAEPVARRIHRLAADAVASSWKGRKKRQRRDEDEDDLDGDLDLPFEIQQPLETLLERFVLRIEPDAALQILMPMIDYANDSPTWSKFAVQGLLGQSEVLKREAAFWPLWQAFADKVRDAKWLARIDDSHPNSDEVGLIRTIFLGGFWNKGVRHWKGLEGGQAARVHQLFDALPSSSTVLESYVRFLYDIGERSLPDAFMRLSSHLQRSGTRATEQLRGRGNTVFMIETMLRRYVYGRPLDLKRRPELRESVILLLEALIDAGSSVAYQMRDDFVTPLPASAS